MPTDLVHVGVDPEQPGVLTVRLNRPEKRNALNGEVFGGLSEAWTRLRDDPSLRSALLTAEGDHFCAGLDLAGGLDGFAAADGAVDALQLRACAGKPIVAAVRGAAFAGGLELMLGADVRVAADNARFGVPEVRRGIFAAGGATVRLPRDVGWANAARLLFTGEPIDASEAHRIGLVQEVAPLGQEEEAARRLARAIAANAPRSLAVTRESMEAGIAEGPAAELARVVDRVVPLFSTRDAQEGIAAFFARRDPVFTGE